MRFSRRSILVGLSGTVPFLAFNRAALAATVVKISLWDKGPASMDMMDHVKPMGLAMAGAQMSMAMMGITASIAEIPTGNVTFQMINDSQEFYHSMTISAVADTAVGLPYLTDKKMVDEGAAGQIAKGKELKPHASATMTVNMKPGTYILYCNIAGHYAMGMWTIVTVTG